jgi:hypothetical protein
MNDRPRTSWIEAETTRLEAERAAMATHCPDMVWRDVLEWPTRRVGAGWEGHAPAWGAPRPEPAGVEELLAGRRLHLRVLYPEGFPMVPPDLYPLDPDVPIDRRTQNRWHVNGDGSLCTVQAAEDWQPANTAADLVRKASCWFVEYLLVDAGDLDAMTKRGIYSDESVDALLAAKFK